VSPIQLDGWTLHSEYQNAGQFLDLAKLGFLGKILLGYLMASTKLLQRYY
jgi:hypothetical protein